jgi:acyl dehydratase
MNVEVGMQIPPWTLPSVDPEKMKILAAILRDPNPIHWDRSEVESRGFGDKVINQGPTNLGYVMNMLMDWAGPRSIRRVQVRFTANVFEGDSVSAGGVVTAVDEGSGLAECEVWLDRADGSRALSGTARVAVS